jgi:hypothetical protein
MVAANNVAQASWLGRQIDAFRLWWQSKEADEAP